MRIQSAEDLSVRLRVFVALALHVQIEHRLIDPVDQAMHRHPGPEHHVHDVRGRQVLHVLDALFDEPRLVPDVQAVQIGEGSAPSSSWARSGGGNAVGLQIALETDGREHPDDEREQSPDSPTLSFHTW